MLEANRERDLADSLAEYSRVRKPDMDALRHFDTISSRIWGGQLLIEWQSPDAAIVCHLTSSNSSAVSWASKRCAGCLGKNSRRLPSITG